MEVFELIAGGVGGVVIGILAGLKLGATVRERPAWYYWAMNGAASVIGVVLATFGIAWEFAWLYVGAIAFMGGGLTGLKYGYGKSVGLWRVHDNLMNSDPDLRD